jgi:ATP-dependent DNA helicase RecQ
VHCVIINQGRNGLPAGGRWEKLDPVGKGRVQVLQCNDAMHQAQAVAQELLRLKQLDNSLDWSQCAVLSTEWLLIAHIIVVARYFAVHQMLAVDTLASRLLDKYVL